MQGSKASIIIDFLKGGVLKPKDISEALGKKGINVSPNYVTTIKCHLVKNKIIPKKKNKIQLIKELVKKGYRNTEIVKILRRRKVNVTHVYVSHAKRVKESKTKIKVKRKSTIYFRKKKLRHWSKELNLSFARVYQLYNNKLLGARIDGTWTPKNNVICLQGKTLKDWSKELNLSPLYIRNLYRNGQLESKINGTWKRKASLRGRYVKGKKLTEWAKLFGITRERARQLANNGKLIERIKKFNETNNLIAS